MEERDRYLKIIETQQETIAKLLAIIVDLQVLASYPSINVPHDGTIKPTGGRIFAT